MSATINCKEFADYFAVPVQNKMNPAYIFEVEGKPHSIEEYYLDDLGHAYHGRVRWSAWNLVLGQTCVHQLWLLGPQPSLSPSWEMLGGCWVGDWRIISGRNLPPFL